jgi:hypothetical protein
MVEIELFTFLERHVVVSLVVVVVFEKHDLCVERLAEFLG